MVKELQLNFIQICDSEVCIVIIVIIMCWVVFFINASLGFSPQIINQNRSGEEVGLMTLVIV